MIKCENLEVLIVEDDTLLRLSVLDMLEDLGHVGIEASNGATALSLLRSMRPIQVMMLDLGLPGMDGRDLAKIARDLRSDLHILFATGHGSEHLGDAAADPKATYLPKPYRLHDLENALNGLKIMRPNA